MADPVSGILGFVFLFAIVAIAGLLIEWASERFQ